MNDIPPGVNYFAEYIYMSLLRLWHKRHWARIMGTGTFVCVEVEVFTELPPEDQVS